MKAVPEESTEMRSLSAALVASLYLFSHFASALFLLRLDLPGPALHFGFALTKMSKWVEGINEIFKLTSQTQQ